MFAKKGALTPPQQCPFQKSGDSFCVYANGRLRRRKRLFGLTQTVARRLLSPSHNGFRTRHGRGLYPERNYLNKKRVATCRHIPVRNATRHRFSNSERPFLCQRKAVLLKTGRRFFDLKVLTPEGMSVASHSKCGVAMAASQKNSN